MAGAIENKLVAGPILALVGGLLILVYGAYEWYVGATVQSLGSLAGLPVTSVHGVVDAGIVGVGLGLLIMVFAVLHLFMPELHSFWGAGMILFAVVSIVSLGGVVGAGLLLAVLGGTACIVYGPVEPDLSDPPTGPENPA